MPYSNEDADMFKIGLKLQQKHNIHLLLATSNPGGGLHQWGLRFISDKQMTLKESEELIAHVIADFMEHVRSDKKLLEERVRRVHTEYRGADLYFRDHPCDPRYFFVRLTFWDKDLNRVLPPYVASNSRQKKS